MKKYVLLAVIGLVGSASATTVNQVFAAVATAKGGSLQCLSTETKTKYNASVSGSFNKEISAKEVALIVLEAARCSQTPLTEADLVAAKVDITKLAESLSDVKSIEKLADRVLDPGTTPSTQPLNALVNKVEADVKKEVVAQEKENAVTPTR